MQVRCGHYILLLGVAIVLAGAGRSEVPVVDAAKRQDMGALRALVAEGADVNARAGDGSTAVLWAAYKNDLASVRFLVESGADVRMGNDLGATPIWAASRNGNPEIASLLLGAGAIPDAALALGEAVLVTAARTGNPGVVRLLLEHGAEVDARGARGQTPLMVAAAQRHPDAVRVLLEYGADVGARSHIWNQMMAQSPHAHPEHQQWVLHGGNSALLFAARSGDLRSVQLLVEAGADLDKASAWGLTPLAMATYTEIGDWWVVEEETNRSLVYFPADQIFPGEHQEVINFLLDAGADPNAGSERFTPLIAAIMRQNEAAVRELLEHGADANLPLGDFTPHQRGSGTDFSFHKSWVGATPLWLAARFGTPLMVEELLDHGADPHFVHRGVYYGGRPGGALSERQEELSTTLMAAVELSGNNGSAWTPVKRDPPTVLTAVRLLVEAGVDVNAIDPDGRTALDGATTLGYAGVIDFLLSAGAESGAGN